MIKTSAFIFLLVIASRISSAQDMACSPGIDPQCMLSLRGDVLLHVVDDRRVLIAVDTDPVGTAGHGRLDNLFLLTGAQIPNGWLALTQPVQASFSLEPTGRYFELKVQDRSRFQLDLDGVQWSHYWGYGDDSAAMLTDLPNAQAADDCAHMAGSCWRVNGFEITFPS